MTFASIKKHALFAAVAVALPGAALGQNKVTDQANQVAESAQELEQEANTLNALTEEARLADATANDALDGNLNDRVGDDDGDEGKWGLLGLLGLAGLLGLRRRERDLHDHRGTTGETRTDRDRDSRI